MKLSKDKKEEIIDCIAGWKLHVVVSSSDWYAEADRETETIRVNLTKIHSIADFFYNLAHEIAHIVFDIQDEQKADEIALKLAASDFFQDAIKLYKPRVYRLLAKTFRNEKNT